MSYLPAIVIYFTVFVLSLLFYSTRLGVRAIYGGPAAIAIDVLAILAGAYVIYFSNLTYLQGVGADRIIIVTSIGAVVSAMHLAKWIVRHRSNAHMR